MGRARGMARQFRDQLEEEVQLEQVRKAQRSATYCMAEPSAVEQLAAAANPTAAPHVPENGGSNSPLAHSANAAGTNATVEWPEQAGDGVERRT